MIVFDLRCGEGHVFEAWFGSSEAFASQVSRGLVCCPICDTRAVEKAVMAPAVSAKSNQAGSDRGRKAELARLAAMQAEVELRCDYVGRDFAILARERHQENLAREPLTGDDEDAARPARGLVGEASMAEAMELIDEGIPVAPLPFRSRRSADA